MNFQTILEHHILDHKIMALGPIFGMELAVTRHLFMMWLVSLLSLAALIFVARYPEKLPHSAELRGRRYDQRSWPRLLRGAIEAAALFIRNEIVMPSLGHSGERYLSYFLTLFFFILLCNLAGLVPWGATATGNISVTAALAGCTFFLIHIAGIREQGLWHYFKSIIPSGLRWWLVPIMIPIELIGFGTKAFALCIRLFANMIAGHIVMLAFLSLIFILGAINPWIGLGLAAPFAVILGLFVYALEIFVAFLQAYIFTFLTALFVGAAVHPEH
ncbi:MAG: F0F1 ATP synthase subunit A [Elusimicrobia bacterium]|nr:F0F1 ATP synthase subunit A [Elusimicrobiota bacterium]